MKTTLLSIVLFASCIGTGTISKVSGLSDAELSEWMPGMEATNAASAFSGLDVSPSWSIATYEVGRPAIAYAEAVAIGKAVGGNRIYR